MTRGAGAVIGPVAISSGRACAAVRDPRDLQRGHPQHAPRCTRTSEVTLGEPRSLVRREGRQGFPVLVGVRCLGRRRIRHLRRVSRLAVLSPQRRAQRARARRPPGPRRRPGARARACWKRRQRHAKARHDRGNRCAKMLTSIALHESLGFTVVGHLREVGLQVRALARPEVHATAHLISWALW